MGENIDQFGFRYSRVARDVLVERSQTILSVESPGVLEHSQVPIGKHRTSGAGHMMYPRASERIKSHVRLRCNLSTNRIFGTRIRLERKSALGQFHPLDHFFELMKWHANA
ncbi:MAG: hypothetical protein ACI9FD_003755 [Gammaproteobacteria bacterium]|jgi:hypothetical protein